MRKTIVSIIFISSLIPSISLAKEGGTIPAEKLKSGLQFHGTDKPEPRGSDIDGKSGFAKIVKGAKLVEYPMATIGSAFDNYRFFSKREWKETRSDNGRTYVDFTGWFKKGNLFSFDSLGKGVSAQAVGIKFLVNSDGSFGAVMASRVELKTDGKIYSSPINNLQGILKMIYENTEIKF